MTNDTSPVINPSALEPLFMPWEEPTAHRVRPDKYGQPAKIVQGRRSSNFAIVRNLRAEVHQWRQAFYAGASDTSRQLLSHWFQRSHRARTESGDEFEFHYYFCQHEAIETLIYLKEVRKLDRLSQLTGEFGGPTAEIDALGVTEEEDAWPKFAFRMATGSGKTKVMSLAVVWSYFHALRESDSDMTSDFVIIAPNLTVYERLKQDFENGVIFDRDPLIPPEWRGDWNMSVVLQDQPSGAATGGTIYLTNIHRLYDPSKRKGRKDAETYEWMGPPVSKATALDTGALLRERITAHKSIMVMNDEAHHVWDPDSAWNEAIQYLNDAVLSKTGTPLVVQLDFSATPKDNEGRYFKHIICDSPLGEAVDAGIVKTPIIGQAKQDLKETPDKNAAYRFDLHLRLGYERWRRSKEEWQKSGKKAVLFVMCEDTEAADSIAARLNTDETFKELNGKTLNLHTNLKGKMKKVGSGQNARMEFFENEKEISDEDLKALRELSRKLDNNTSPYLCIVSVLMLREGWDIRNVTTIVPLRPYSSKANILPEQTLGRGLRRITPPGQANELVTVVDHPAFASLYQQELAQEGLAIEIVDVEHVPSTTVSIYPDERKKDVKALDIALPSLTPGHRLLPVLEGLTIDDVKTAFARYRPLPLGTKGSGEIDYEGRHLMTGEVIERMKIYLPLLQSGVGAVSYFVKELQTICQLRGLHATLGPLIQTFLEEILFARKTSLVDEALVSRLADSDVAEHIRAVFVPLIRSRTTKREVRVPTEESVSLAAWRPYQVTHSERHPVLEAARTLFNLVPCNRDLEVAFAKYADAASDVAAFAKNAGPQALRIDYQDGAGRIAFYTPDFFVRTTTGLCYMVETKGREDRDVPRKARAAIAWCESASISAVKWEYLYVPQGVFDRATGNAIADLARSCAPAREHLVTEEDFQARAPLFAGIAPPEEEKPDTAGIVDDAFLKELPQRYREAVSQAAMLFRFFENKPNVNFAPALSALLPVLDEAAKGLIVRRLQPDIPAKRVVQDAWFNVTTSGRTEKPREYYQQMARNLLKTLIFNTGMSPLGLLRKCLDFALNDNTRIAGVFEKVRERFKVKGGRDLLAVVEETNDFRNTAVVHQEQPLRDAALAEKHLKKWIEALRLISSS